MDAITLEAFKAINPDAHQKALDVIGECGCPDDGDVVEPEEFDISPHPTHPILNWRDYGPFNPFPQWVWDPETSEWVSNDDPDDEDMKRYRALEDKHYGR